MRWRDSSTRLRWSLYFAYYLARYDSNRQVKQTLNVCGLWWTHRWNSYNAAKTVSNGPCGNGKARSWSILHNELPERRAAINFTKTVRLTSDHYRRRHLNSRARHRPKCDKRAVQYTNLGPCWVARGQQETLGVTTGSCPPTHNVLIELTVYPETKALIIVYTVSSIYQRWIMTQLK